MTFDPTLVSNFFLILTGFGGAFIAALWISLVIWTYREDFATADGFTGTWSLKHCA